MTDSKELLTQELSILYPDVTDVELNQMTEILIELFTIGAKAFYEAEYPSESRINDINVTYLEIY